MAQGMAMIRSGCTVRVRPEVCLPDHGLYCPVSSSHVRMYCHCQSCAFMPALPPSLRHFISSAKRAGVRGLGLVMLIKGLMDLPLYANLGL